MNAATTDLLQAAIADPETQWSLGTFGAIAEFSRDPDEPVVLRQAEDAMSAVTARGGIAIQPSPAPPRHRLGGHYEVGLESKIALCLSKPTARWTAAPC